MSALSKLNLNKTMSEEIPTPRTDEISRSLEWWRDCWLPYLEGGEEKFQQHFVPSEKARQLETELTHERKLR